MYPPRLRGSLENKTHRRAGVSLSESSRRKDSSMIFAVSEGMMRVPDSVILTTHQVRDMATTCV